MITDADEFVTLTFKQTSDELFSNCDIFQRTSAHVQDIKSRMIFRVCLTKTSKTVYLTVFSVLSLVHFGWMEILTAKPVIVFHSFLGCCLIQVSQRRSFMCFVSVICCIIVATLILSHRM